MPILNLAKQLVVVVQCLSTMARMTAFWFRILDSTGAGRTHSRHYRTASREPCSLTIVISNA